MLVDVNLISVEDTLKHGHRGGKYLQESTTLTCRLEK